MILKRIYKENWGVSIMLKVDNRQNLVVLVGDIQNIIELANEFYIVIIRTNCGAIKSCEELPLLVSKTIVLDELAPGKTVRIRGKLYSCDSDENELQKYKIIVYVEYIEVITINIIHYNDVLVSGTVASIIRSSFDDAINKWVFEFVINVPRDKMVNKKTKNDKIYCIYHEDNSRCISIKVGRSIDVMGRLYTKIQHKKNRYGKIIEEHTCEIFCHNIS